MSEKAKIVVKVPEITPELIQKNEEEQKKWRRLYAAPVVTADKHAEAVIRDHLATLDMLEQQTKRARRGERAPIKNKIRELRRDAAVWMASVGKFAEAETLSPDTSQKKLYRAYRKAVARPDSESCGHPNWKRNERGETEQNVYREFTFYSEKHGRRVSMVKCRECGFRNARDLSNDLQKLSDFRAASRKLAETVPREHLEHRLKAQNLHKTNLSEIVK